MALQTTVPRENTVGGLHPRGACEALWVLDFPGISFSSHAGQSPVGDWVTGTGVGYRVPMTGVPWTSTVA